MRLILLLLALLLPATVDAQGLKEALVRHQTTGTATVDQLCDTNRTSGACLPFEKADGAAGTIRAIDGKSAERYSIADWCAPSALDGSTDNTVCIQAAVTAICANTHAGGTLWFPAMYGYTVNAATGITIHCEGFHIQGDGWGDHTSPLAKGSGTLVRIIGSGSANIFNWVPTSFRVSPRYAAGGGISDLIITGADTSNSGTIPQTGWTINFEHCERCTVNGIRIENVQNGVRIYAGFASGVRNSDISQIVTGGEAIRLEGSDSEAGCSTSIGTCSGRGDVYIVENIVADANNVVSPGQSLPDCIHVKNFAATPQGKNIVCNQFRHGLLVDCPDSATQGACPSFGSFYDFESEAFDNNVGDGANISISDGAHFVFHDAQLFGYAVTNNVSLLNTRFSNAGDIQFIGGRIGYARASCIVSSVDQTFFGAGLAVQGCGSSSPGTYYGIDLRPGSNGEAAAVARVIGVDFCRNQGGPTGASNIGAVRISAGVDYANVTGNSMFACGTGITNSGGSHSNTSGNVGP